MRVLHVITTIDRGGAENQLLLLVREQVKLGHEVSIFPLKGNLELADQFKAYGATVISHLSNKNLFSQFVFLKRLTKDFSITHGHLPRAEVFTSLANKGKYVLSRHNCESFLPNHPGMLSSFLSRIVSQRALAVIAISETVKLFLEERNEVVTNKIKVVRYGFDKTINYSTNLKITILNGDPIVGTVSRLTPQKDLETLVLAFSKVALLYPNARLVIVGEGILKQSLQTLTSKLGIADQVDWLGRTPSPLEIMSQMTTFVMTSRYEGFGLVVLEAISQGVPVIVSNNPTFSEIFENHKQSLFPLGDADELANMIMSSFEKQTRKKLIDDQESLLETFSPSSMINHMQLVYEGKEL